MGFASYCAHEQTPMITNRPAPISSTATPFPPSPSMRTNTHWDWGSLFNMIIIDTLVYFTSVKFAHQWAYCTC
jgi:hypothetical protein